MGIDFKRSYESVFKSENFLFKLLFPIVLCVTGLYLPYITSNIVFPYYLLFALAGCIYAGFSLDFMHNEIHGISPTLPALKGNIPRYLKSGFKMVLITVLYFVLLNITALILIILISLPLEILASLVSGLKELNNIWILLSNVGAQFFIYLIHTAITCVCADGFRFMEVFNGTKIMALIASAKKEFLVVIIAQFAFAFFLLLVGVLSRVFLFMLVLAPFVAVLGLVWTNLAAQAYTTAKHRLEEKYSSAEYLQQDVIPVDEQSV